MREVKRSALIAASPARLFALINDVEHYPEFLPWCASAEVKQRDAGQVIATLGVRKGLLRAHFTTRNVLEPERSIRMELVDGPFRSLQGLWTLTPLAADGAVAGCRVDFNLRFEFAGSFGGAMLEPVFEAMAGSLIDAFVTRARNTAAST